MTINAMATVINMNVIFRSAFRCRCCRLRVDDDANELSIPLALLVDIIER